VDPFYRIYHFVLFVLLGVKRPALPVKYFLSSELAHNCHILSLCSSYVFKHSFVFISQTFNKPSDSLETICELFFIKIIYKTDALCPSNVNVFKKKWKK
jgi:hypothetical protein